MKHLLRFCLLVAAVGAFTTVASADTINSSSSTVTYLGVNSNNAKTDPTFDYSNMSNLTSSDFTSDPSGTVDITSTGDWTKAIAGTFWVSNIQSGPDCSGSLCPASGTYVFQSDFTTTAIPTDATITVMADDTTAVYLNGVLIAGTPSSIGTGGKCTTDTPNCTTPFTFDLPSSDFLLGANTLTFGVEQLYGDAMGVDFQANNIPLPTPEPSSLLLLGTGLLGAAETFRRRLRK